MSLLNDKEIPIGLGMALAQNLDAMQVFSSLDEFSKERFLARSKSVNSKEEMNNLVSELVKM